MSESRLNQPSISELYQAVVALGLDRSVLLAGIPPGLVYQLDQTSAPGPQIYQDLHKIARIETLTDGSDPLRQWLSNAKELAGGRVEGMIFERHLRALSPVSQAPRSSGSEAPVLLSLLRELQVTRAAFEAQSRLRDQLVQHISERLVLNPYDPFEYEPFFLRHFASMDAEEKRLFHSIRGLTLALFQHNAKGMTLLNDLTDAMNALCSLGGLRTHLALWIAKYEHSFLASPEMCLVYLGPEEGAPFPSDVELEIFNALKEMGYPGLLSSDAPPEPSEHHGTGGYWEMALYPRWVLKRLTELDAKASKADALARKEIEVDMAKVISETLPTWKAMRDIARDDLLDRLYASIRAFNQGAGPQWPLELIVASSRANGALAENGDWMILRTLLPFLPVLAFYGDALKLDTELPAIWSETRGHLLTWTIQNAAR